MTESQRLVEILELTKLALLPPWAGYRGRYTLKASEWLPETVPVIVVTGTVFIHVKLLELLKAELTYDLSDDELAALLAYNSHRRYGR